MYRVERPLRRHIRTWNWCPYMYGQGMMKMEAEIQNSQSRTRNILIVDDIENNLVLLEGLLTGEGYNVVSAVNGKDALEKLHSEKEKEFDLIISDILMPIMDGFMLCENVRKDVKLRNIPFVFSTASYIEEKDEALALKLGARKFIRKPFEPDKFLELVQELLKDVDNGKVKTQEISLENDNEVRQLYNERLVAKLERKVLALENEISERKRAEEALQRSSSLLSSVIESPDNIIIFALDTNYNYLCFNLSHVKVMKKVYGADIEIGHNNLMCIKKEGDRLRAEENYKRVLKGERFAKLQEYGQSSNRLWYELIFNPIYDSSDHVVGFTVFVIDVTEQKKMEEALLKSEKLKSIGTLAAGISHEFNNILAVISGNLQLLNETCKDQEGLKKSLSTMKMAVDDGTQISRKMLMFTKTKKDAEEFVLSDIRDLITQSIDFTSPRWKNEAQAKGIDYQIYIDGMKSVSSIMCNPSELREVFINIIYNALDAMPDGGNLSFSTWSGDSAVFISASDTGDGMSEETKKNIFDPFFTTKMAIGTGLGMSLSYGIITRHGGNIDVESEVGKGTKFTLQFPTTNESVGLITDHEPEQELSKRDLRILVVDDEEALCAILDQFFSMCGNKVKTVNNGSDAIHIVKTEDFDLVLCDLAMPDILGYDVIEVLNKLEKRPKIGIITGWGKKLNPMQECMDVDFIARKPFDFSELTKQINDLEF